MAEADFTPAAACYPPTTHSRAATLLYWTGDNIGFSDGKPIFTSFVDGDGQSICLTLGSALARADSIDCHGLYRILSAAKAAADAGELGAADTRAWGAWQLSCGYMPLIRCGFDLDGDGHSILLFRGPTGESYFIPVSKIAERMRRPRWRVTDANGTDYGAFSSYTKATRYAYGRAEFPGVGCMEIAQEVYQ